MKKLSTVLILAAAAVACGTENSKVPASQVSSIQAEASAGRAYAVEGTVQSVQVKSAQAPAMGIWTEVEIAYDLPCYAQFESFAYNLRYKDDGKIEILASAIESSAPIGPDTFVCQAMSLLTKTVTLSGVVAAENISLVNLQGAATVVPAATASFSVDTPLEIMSVRPLCPAGEMCLVGGTIVTVRAHFPCADALGPVTYAANQSLSAQGDARVNLAVSAVTLVNRDQHSVVCKKENTVDRELTLVNVFGDRSAIDLTLVK